MKFLWIAIYLSVLIWSGVDPKDYFTWIMEVLPAVIGGAVLAATYSRFKLTTVTYVLILIHCVILMVGGHYTYAEVPLFDWIKDFFDLQRNNYDKLGHFAQGFIPAIVAREILIRNDIIKGKGWLNFFIICFCLAVSALYEIIEWQAAVSFGDSTEAFLGTQGYVWDTQSDMWFALAGSVAALLSLSRFHDNQLKNFLKSPDEPQPGTD
jgi:putative membrane protein